MHKYRKGLEGSDMNLHFPLCMYYYYTCTHLCICNLESICKCIIVLHRCIYKSYSGIISVHIIIIYAPLFMQYSLYTHTHLAGLLHLSTDSWSNTPGCWCISSGPNLSPCILDTARPIGQTIGYQVYYTGPTSGIVSVDGVESNNQTVSGLVNGELYHFSVAGRSHHFESELVPAAQNPVGLSKFYSPLPFLLEEQ